jgi:predicted DNA-binding transcriptional regulator AlpA
MEQKEKPQTVQLPEVANALGIAIGSAYQAARRGDLPFPCVKIGNRFVIPEAPFRRFLETGKAA